MKPALLVLLAIVLTAAAVFAIGAALPATREATASRTIAAPPELVQATILDIASQPDWRSTVSAVEAGAGAGPESSLADRGWTEVSGTGERVSFRLVRQAPGLITLSFESPRGYTGRWEARLVAADSRAEGAAEGRAEGRAEGAATVITVREEATTPAPLGRILARLFFDQQAFATTYLDELAAEAARRHSREP